MKQLQLLRWRIEWRELWLFLSRFLLLSWFVLFLIPVTQEVGTTSDDVSTEKLSLVVSLKVKPTPHLVSLSQTETIIADIDASSLIVSSSIAPATPLEEEDINVLYPVSDLVYDDESGRHASDKELKEESQSEILNEEIKYEGKTEQFAAKTSIDGSDDNVDDFQIKGPDFNKQDTSLELPSVDSVIINDGDLKKDLESKQDDARQTKDNIDVDKQDVTKHDLKFSEEESNDPVETVMRDEAPGDEKPLDESAEDSQDAEGYVGTHDDHDGPQEDMPSFKEWRKKFLAQEEQKNKVQQSNEKGNQETNTQAKKNKSDRKQNNYASVDCGAKVLENNIEAQNAESILLENKDFYMLNPCSANIWFIVELCDHVQVTSLQLANLELFSSTIAKFQVSFSTRYPTREWEQLHTFTARSEKAIQTFKLEPIFAKYMKVEQRSFHGSEHYCPWSLLRVYGNSMVEEYEAHESSQEEGGATVDDDDGASSNVEQDHNVSGGLLQTATNAVLNFVKETAKKLVKSEGNSSNFNSTNSTKPAEEPLNSETPRSIVQLMDHEDFKASCHEVNTDEVVRNSETCLPGTGCSSTASPVSSHQMFFEIVNNVCRRDFRNTKACFNNMAKSIAVNKTTTLPTMEPKSKDIVLDKVDIVEKNEMVNNLSQTGSSSDEEQSDKYTETIDTTDTMTTEQDSLLDTISSSQTLLPAKVEISENTAFIILPSSSSSSAGSQSVTADMVMPDKINHPSSPTPLAKPPLDVKQVPDTGELPTEPSLANTEEGNNKNPVVTSNDNHPSETTVTMVNSGQLSATKHVTPNQGSTISSESIALVSPDKSISSIAGNTAAVESGGTNSESHYQETPGDEGQNLMLEKGTPNPCAICSGSAVPSFVSSSVNVILSTSTSNDLDVSDRSKSENDITLKDGTTNDTEVPNEPTSQVDSGSSSLKENPETLDIINESESDDVFGNHEKGATVEIEKETESEQKEEQIEQENGKIEGKHDRDINDQEISSKVDGNVEHNVLKIDSVITCNSEKCDVKEYEVEMDEEGTKNAKRKIEGDSDSLSDPDPGPTISVGQTNSKKESIFVAMSRKIKALEQNVTMTNLFLEELSQRYRNSFEEMQKKIEKKLSVMSKNSKLLTQVNLSQNTTILALTLRLQKVEEKLDETTLRLKVVNQEVVERHVLGMCLQFIIFLLLWYFRGNTQNGGNENFKIDPVKHDIDGDDKVGNNGQPNYSSVEDIGQDSMEKSLEEVTSKPSSSETTVDGKRRRRRRNRPLSVTSEQLLDHGTSQGQNIVTKTAGLLFHGCHKKGEKLQEGILKNAAQRSCSADSLNDIPQMKDERKMNTKKSAASPKAKKIAFRNTWKIENGCTSKVRQSDLPVFNSDCKFDTTKEVDGHKQLIRSKSFDVCASNGVNFSNNTTNDFTSGGRKTSSPVVRCAMQSDSCDQLNNQKSKWIWGFG